MARTAKKLTARGVATAKPGRHGDGDGLYLVVSESGAKKWVLRFSFEGKSHDAGLGSARDGEVSLAEAREKARAMRDALKNGDHPLALRMRADAPTFGPFADAFLEQMQSQWRNQKHIAQWRMTLTTYAAPLRDKALDRIGTEDVLAVLQPLWQRTPETAERLRGRIERVLDAAKARGLRDGENPARWRGHLEQLLPRRQRLTRGHHAACL